MTSGVREEGAPSGQHPVEHLFDVLSGFSYPDGVVPVPKRISGTAFFPGGSGLWREEPRAPLPPMPIGKVMVLGNYFDTEDGYRKSRQNGDELHTPTWNNLLPLLGSAGIRREQCFFTNAYMGLSVGDRNTGPSPGARDPEFKRRCESFLIEQIAVQKPRLILTLGRFVPAFIAALSPGLAAWRRCASFSELDDSGPLKQDVQFDGAVDLATVVVALVHPSLRKGNVWRRRYQEWTGNDAELAMLKKAVELAAIR